MMITVTGTTRRFRVEVEVERYAHRFAQRPSPSVRRGEKRRKARTMAAVLLAKLCFRCVVRFSDREYMR